MTTAKSRTDTRDQVRAGPKTRAADVSSQLAALHEMGRAELRALWRRLRRGPPPLLSRDLMKRVLAYDLQARVHGGLSKAVQRRLASLAGTLEQTGGDVMTTPALRLKPGARLVREWHGRTHTVLVQERGYAYDGRSFRSLSQIARQITGVRWSGPRFFGLVRTKPADARKAD
jgi:hypothetical protein